VVRAHIEPAGRAAYELLHEANLALMDIEQYGIHIDTAYCERQSKYLKRKIAAQEEGLKKREEFKVWHKVYGRRFNLDSNPQLADVLYNHMGIKPPKYTDKDKPSVDKDALEALDLPIVLRETVGGIMRPFFHTHTARTFRGSSTNVNFQNLPIRQPEQGKMVRRAFIPRPGHVFGGVDYSGIEVRISACYHKDPTMINYINDPASDMHRDMAMEIFLLKKQQITGPVRYTAKSNFVFAEFYGDFYGNCATYLWHSVRELMLKTAGGTPMYEHLQSKGIKSYRQFEEHLREVEYAFWNKRFPVYKAWKDEQMARYERDGYIAMFTGFKCSGVMLRKEVINYPIQGTAFHCLLWSLIQIHKWMKARRLRSRIVGQIHDEITQDNHPEEQDTVLTKEHKIMCQDIKAHWSWIIVPLDIEAEFAGIDESWHYKQKVPITREEVF
jgi:DNA polymerase-1